MKEGNLSQQRPHYEREIWNHNHHSSFWICVSGNLGQGNFTTYRDIIVFDKLRFREGLVWTVDGLNQRESCCTKNKKKKYLRSCEGNSLKKLRSVWETFDESCSGFLVQSFDISLFTCFQRSVDKNLKKWQSCFLVQFASSFTIL